MLLLRQAHLPRWHLLSLGHCNLRSLHTSSVLHSRYRGYNMHGTLREWALRMIQKDLGRMKERRIKGERRLILSFEAVRRMTEADAMVYNTLEGEERRRAPPKGRGGRLMAVGDKVRAGMRDPGTAESEEERVRILADRRGRLREALRLYLRAAKRPDGSMPLLGTRIWGTSRMLEHRLWDTARSLDKAESTVDNPPPKRDTVNWGIRPQHTSLPAQWSTPIDDELLPATQAALRVAPTARGVAYKTNALPPLHRLAPSAIQRARLPLLSAFPGVGAVGDTILSVGHATYAAQGLLGTPAPAPASSSSPRIEPAPDVASPPYLSYVHHHPNQPPPSDGMLRPPPIARRGKTLRWFKYRPKRHRFMLTCFPLPHVPPPRPAQPGSGRAAALGGRAPDTGIAKTVGAGVGPSRGMYAERTAPELAWFRQPTPRSSLAHALRIRLAGRETASPAHTGSETRVEEPFPPLQMLA
ncbi:hypothetical protein GGX14DRAFT_398333 [Mycena pura]|uniref:Uncharacterized protein n=1 Tax=Mycena pura TaxID=153505 RepID=A0AAD6VB13_9AGAR|nr:hypothetical protein GGX14DRAFT_398333 [Mycena pura]